MKAVTTTDYLTVKQVAQLKGCSEQYVRLLVSQDKLEHEEDAQPGNHIKQWLIPVSTLDARLQAKYYGRTKPKKPLELPEEKKPLDAYSAEERRQIDGWINILKDWIMARYGQDRQTADAAFIARMAKDRPDLRLSEDILYRHWRAWRDHDYDALVDKRGKARKGHSAINETIWQAFLSYYLDQAKFPIKGCYSYTQMYLKKKHPELLADLPSYSSFYRRTQTDIPIPIKVLGREGEKAFDDRCGPYIRREYNDMVSNEFWIADNHTFDIISEGGNGKRHRLYLTAFMDALSGVIVGFHITDNPSSDATIYALRKAILKYGIPTYIYVDNGREFLTHDVGGLGHRKKKSTEEFTPPPIFARLGITMINAQVRNARAKVIERRFLDFKNHISRLFPTFTGGNVLEKPERLKEVLKSGYVPSDHTLRETIGRLLDGYFNEQPYNGPITEDNGKNRMDVYYEHLQTKRVASAEDLALMLMRSTRPQKVGRMGVHLNIGGYRIDYRDDDFCLHYQGKQVYVRYDPENISEVRVYDEEDRYIKTVKANSNMISGYVTSAETAKDAIHLVKSAKKLAKQEIKTRVLAAADRIDALDLVLGEAQQNIAARLEDAQPDKSVMEIRRVEEQPLLREVNDMPLDVMIRNKERQLGKTQN